MTSWYTIMHIEEASEKTMKSAKPTKVKPTKAKVSLAHLLPEQVSIQVINDKIENVLQNVQELHTSELDDGVDWNRLNLQSVTEQNTLDEFLATAEIAGTEFQAERLNVSLVSGEKHTGLPSLEEERVLRAAQDKHRTMLRIPRRPPWTSEMSAAELDRKEKDSFLEWRRGLAELQEVEGIVMTPFERNLDFWRQLWRVIERSDVVVQIVDARNPLLFRCEDLEAYVKEVDPRKRNMLLVNKADHLSLTQRNFWAEYFDAQGLMVAFWSAVQEAEKQNAANEEEGEEPRDNNESESEEENESESDSVISDNEGNNKENITEKDSVVTNMKDSDQQKTIDATETELLVSQIDSGENHLQQETEADTNLIRDCDKLECDSISNLQDDCKSCDSLKDGAANSSSQTNQPSASSANSSCILEKKNNSTVLNGDELVELFKSLHDPSTSEKGITTIGLVGYPNVGKSSSINALLQTKKVPVSATPGRTKHFQTLFLDSTLLLCDCPGLVMPMFVSTKAEMIVSGILPVDQMRDYIPPVSLVCRHIPRAVFETTYGILLPKPKVEDGEAPDRLPTAHELLTSYACMRGFMTHKGVPDFQRASRYVLKDYINGRLLYCHYPPTASVEEFEPAAPAMKEVKLNKMAAKTAQGVQPSSIDADFFSKTQIRMGSKGVQGVSDFARLQGFTGHHSNSDIQERLSAKPWKKHGNRNKREKLRRLNKHLDA